MMVIIFLLVIMQNGILQLKLSILGVFKYLLTNGDDVRFDPTEYKFIMEDITELRAV